MNSQEMRDRIVRLAMAHIGETEGKDILCAHPDEDIMNAFVENKLDGKRLAETEAHIARCPECRELAAALMKIAEKRNDKARLIRFSHIDRRWLAAAAMVFVLVGLYLLLNKANVLPWREKRAIPREDMVVIVTDEEASLPMARELIIEKSDGPGIKVVSPKKGDVSHVPVDIHILFKKSPAGLKPDMSTLRVYYQRLDLIDITSRFSSSIVNKQINLKDAYLPPGEHVLVISIRDIGGNEAVYKMVIAVE